MTSLLRCHQLIHLNPFSLSSSNIILNPNPLIILVPSLRFYSSSSSSSSLLRSGEEATLVPDQYLLAMGCGVSRPITDERTAPVSGGFRPIRRKIEELKRMRGVHTITGSTPSKKELLEGRVVEVEDQEDDDESHTSPKSLIHDHTQKNTEDDVKSAKELSSMPEKEKEKEGSRISISEDTMKPPPAQAQAQAQAPAPVQAPAPILTSGEKRTEVMVEKGGGGGEEKEKEEENEEEEEDDEEENGYGYIDGPSSPSFRDYYVPSVGNSMELTDPSKEEDANEGVKKEKKSRRNESIASSEGSVTQLVKKRSSKGRRFRRALPKSLGLNVRSCYTPPCTSSHDNPQQLLNAKVVHAS